VDAATRAATERWFLRQGVPHFIEDYDAGRDIWTRALPFLVLVFLAQTLNALKAEWEWWVNVLAFAGGVALALGAWALANRARHRRPFQRPDDVGPWELTIFVLVPPLIPLVFGGQIGSALATLIGNVLLLAIAYVATSYALVPLTVWGVRRLGRQLGTVLDVVTRALPLLLLFVTFLFLTTEAWQVASTLSWGRVALLTTLFLLIAAAFALLRAPRQLAELAEPAHDDVSELVDGSPIEDEVPEVEPLPDRRPLSNRQRGNVVLVVVVGEGVQVLIVAVVMLAFFVLLGTLAVSEDVARSWIGAEPDVLLRVSAVTPELVLTEQLVKVACFLSAFSALFFTVSLLTDATYRDEFLPEVLDDVRRSLAVRDVYLAALAPARTDSS
jgi:hypothetical protein